MVMKRVICAALLALGSMKLGEAHADVRKCDAPVAQAGVSHTCNDKVAGTSCWAYCGNGYEGLPAKYECKAAEGDAPPSMAAVEKPISCAVSVRRLEPDTARRLSACDATMSTVGLDAVGIESDCAGQDEGGICVAYCTSPGYDGGGAAAVTMRCTNETFVFMVPGSTLPTCTPMPCTFTAPNGPGVTSDCNGTGTGETCTAECSGAFEYDAGAGPATFTCGADGTFVGTSPTCVPKPCTVQDELMAYDTSSCKDKTDTENCGISCPAGYDGGPFMYRCNGTTGNFVPVEDAANCTPAVCESGIPTSADLNTTGVTGLTTGESGDMTCASGYDGQATNWTCGTTGAVTGVTPTCTPMECNASTIEADVTVTDTCSGKVFGDTCDMLCNEGYELAPGETNQVWECVTDGTTAMLNGTVPNCTAKPCDTSGFSDYVSSGCDGITVGQNCSYSCPYGTEGRAGAPSVQNFSCIAEGAGTRLAGTPPVCVPMTCSGANITTTPNTCDGIEVGQACSLQCERGYDGSTTYTCMVDDSNLSASLNGSELVCVGRPCATASLPVGVQQHVHNCSNITTNETCNVSCAPGYAGESVLVMCGADGLYQPLGDFPACPIITSTATESTTSMTGTTATETHTTGTTASSTATTASATTATETTATGTGTSVSSATSVTTETTVTITTVSSATMTSVTTATSVTTMTNTTVTETTSATDTTHSTVSATSVSVTTITTASATSVTDPTATTSATATGTVPAGFTPGVTAKVQMTVTNPSDFITSTAVQTGFNTFLATYLGLDAADINTAFSLLSSRRLRRLQGGNVEADVTATIPEGSSTSQAEVETRLNDMDSQQSTDLDAALVAEGATGFDPTVEGATNVEQSLVQETTTPAPPAPSGGDGGSDEKGASGAVIAIVIVLCVLFIVAVGAIVAYFLYKRRGKEGNNNNPQNTNDTNADASGEIPEDAMDEHGAGVEVRARKFQVNLPQAEDNAPADAEGIRGR